MNDENLKAICRKLYNAYSVKGINDGNDVINFFKAEHEALGLMGNEFEHHASTDRIEGCDEVNVLYQGFHLQVEICFSPHESKRSLTVHHFVKWLSMEGGKKTLLMDSKSFKD